MELLRVDNISKKFNGNAALNQVSLTINRGEIHSLVGENGAGKSTLIKIITGVYKASSGHVFWDGNRVNINNPTEAKQLGINVIHQDRNLIPSFSGLENLFLNQQYPRKKLWFGIDWKEMRRQANVVMREWGVNLPLDKLVSEMSPSQRTMLEITRAMMMNSKLLFLDEPTASLTDQESELLFSFIERLKLKGVAIIYVSHRLDEVLRLSDNITVLTSGEVSGTLSKNESTNERLIELITGGKTLKKSKSAVKSHSESTSILNVSNLSTKDKKVKSASFTLYSNEILGVFGLAGAGRTEMLEAIYGLREKETGCISFKNKEITLTTPLLSLSRGLVLIPENRHDDGLIMNFSIKENMTLPILKLLSKRGAIQKREEKSRVETEMNRFKVKANHPEQKAEELSGGNQQKVVFAKALLSNPELFLCDEPTQAVDIMTRGEIHHFLRGQANSGKGILFVSSDLQEILDVSDRILIMSEGRTIIDMQNINLSAENILNICYKEQKGAAIST